jgi:hypothetical protein
LPLGVKSPVSIGTVCSTRRRRLDCGWDRPAAAEKTKMLNCSISGCKNCFSEILGLPRLRERWFVGTAEDWPQLAEPGVPKIVLCPDHRREVFNEILAMRKSQAA